jgi:protein involved in polysaccharide export with SLBB domain
MLGAACLLVSGCVSPLLQNELPAVSCSAVPRELDKSTFPIYRVEPPDILLIEAVHNIRPPQDRLRAGDELVIRVSNTIPPDPTETADPVLNQFRVINAVYQIQANGSVDLGPEYKSVQVAGLTMEQARDAIERHLRANALVKEAQVAVSMTDISGKQVITGQHLVRMDGTISLGVYGSVFITGMTLDEVKAAVEAHLSNYIHQPEVNVDVMAYNSKVYYVVTDGGGFGEQLARFPCTGNETVLDAVAQIQGLSDVSSKRVWIARPSPAGGGAEVAQNLNVDWRAITEDGVTTTNYQIFPGDRIYIRADHMIVFDNWVAKTTAPFERIFGFTLLGNGLVRRLQTNQTGGSGNGGF